MISTAPPAKRLRRHHRKLKRWNMSKNDVLSKFPVHRLEGALRFSAHEVRVGNRAPDFACRISAAKSPAFWLWRRASLKLGNLGKSGTTGTLDSTIDSTLAAG